MPETAPRPEASRSYLLNINKRFAYVKRYGVLRRPLEKVENPLVKQARSLIMGMTGRKGEKRR